MSSKVVIQLSANALESVDAVCETLKVKPNTVGRGKAIDSLVACAAELVGLRREFKKQMESISSLEESAKANAETVDELNDKILDLEEVNRSSKRLLIHLMNASPND